MDKLVLKYRVRLEQYRGFNVAALLSEGKHEIQITCADSHQLSTKEDQMPLCGRQEQNGPIGEDRKKKNTGEKHRIIAIKSWTLCIQITE